MVNGSQACNIGIVCKVMCHNVVDIFSFNILHGQLTGSNIQILLWETVGTFHIFAIFI